MIQSLLWNQITLDKCCIKEFGAMSIVNDLATLPSPGYKLGAKTSISKQLGFGSYILHLVPYHLCLSWFLRAWFLLILHTC